MSQELYKNYVKILSSVEIQNKLFVGENIGIGTLNPTEKLDVVGNTKISGDLHVNSNIHVLSSLTVNRDVTVLGKLSALGISYFANTVFSTTSAICAYNVGPGPALYVYQAAGPYDVASFYDGDGVEVLHVGNATPNGNGFVGINNGDPNVELSVKGSVSATESACFDGNVKVGVEGERISNLTVTGIISSAGAAYIDGNLIQPEFVDLKSKVNSLSSNWNNVYTSVNNTSGNWNDVYTTVYNTSGNWDNNVVISYSNNSFLPLSGGTVTGDVVFLSSVEFGSGSTAVLFVSDAKVGINTEIPNKELTVIGSISSSEIIYTQKGNSNFWNNVYTSVNNVSGNWNSVYTNVNTTSANYILDGGNTKGSNLLIGTNDNFNLTLETNALPRVTVINVGNVGIGTTTPNETLTVVGNISASGKLYGDGSSLTGITGITAGVSIDTGVRSISSNWQNTYTTVQGQSSQWASNVDTGVRAITGDFSVKSETVKYFPLSGGIITGNTQINSNLTVYGNISATGTSYFANTVYSTTSALSVINIGNTGPALYVGNNGTGDIASFYDLDQNVEVFHIAGSNGTFPNVGVKTSSPNVDFTVNGQISSNNIITSLGGNSTNWNSVYSNVQTNSANYILDNGNTKGSNLLIGTNDNFNLALETNGSPRVTILNSGNVGINTSTPNERLTVSGNISASGRLYGDGSSLTGITTLTDSDSNASINVTSPTFVFSNVTYNGVVNNRNSYSYFDGDLTTVSVFFNGTRWVVDKNYDGDPTLFYAATGNENFPWEANWTGSGINSITRVNASSTSLGRAATNGVSLSAARADHVHPYPTLQQLGAAPAEQGVKAWVNFDGTLIQLTSVSLSGTYVEWGNSNEKTATKPLHNLKVGAAITISGQTGSNSRLNGTWTVKEVVNANSFKFDTNTANRNGTFMAGGYSALNDVTWSGTQFVAVGASGTILTSPDGITWTTRTSGTTSGLNAVVWSGTQFVAVGASGVIRTSPDGITWTTRASGTTASINDIAWSGSLFMGVCSAVSSIARIVTSPDGITWTAVDTGLGYTYSGITWNSFSSYFMLISNASDGLHFTSVNGTSFGYWQDNNTTATSIVWSSGTAQAISVNSSGSIYAIYTEAFLPLTINGRNGIRSSYNVSSITFNGTGDYTVNFSTPMTDTNYLVLATTNASSTTSRAGRLAPFANGTVETSIASTYTASAVQVKSYNESDLATDKILCSVAIIR